MRRVLDQWTEAEGGILRDLFPVASWPSILCALPNRNRSAINQAARAQGLARDVNKRTPWSSAEISTLWRLYPSADAEIVESALQSRGSLATIAKKASALGIKRQSPGIRTNKRFVHPLIRQLREEREKRKMGRPELEEKSGYHVSQILSWELGKVNPDFMSMHDWAEALGFELILRKKMVGEIVPWPDTKRLMAGR